MIRRRHDKRKERREETWRRERRTYFQLFLGNPQLRYWELDLDAEYRQDSQWSGVSPAQTKQSGKIFFLGLPSSYDAVDGIAKEIQLDAQIDARPTIKLIKCKWLRKTRVHRKKYASHNEVTHVKEIIHNNQPNEYPHGSRPPKPSERHLLLIPLQYKFTCDSQENKS